jgi:hypothetical protein
MPVGPLRNMGVRDGLLILLMVALVYVLFERECLSSMTTPLLDTGSSGAGGSGRPHSVAAADIVAPSACPACEECPSGTSAPKPAASCPPREQCAVCKEAKECPPPPSPAAPCPACASATTAPSEKVCPAAPSCAACAAPSTCPPPPSCPPAPLPVPSAAAGGGGPAYPLPRWAPQPRQGVTRFSDLAAAAAAVAEPMRYGRSVVAFVSGESGARERVRLTE